MQTQGPINTVGGVKAAQISEWAITPLTTAHSNVLRQPTNTSEWAGSMTHTALSNVGGEVLLQDASLRLGRLQLHILLVEHWLQVSHFTLEPGDFLLHLNAKTTRYSTPSSEGWKFKAIKKETMVLCSDCEMWPYTEWKLQKWAAICSYADSHLASKAYSDSDYERLLWPIAPPWMPQITKLWCCTNKKIILAYWSTNISFYDLC